MDKTTVTMSVERYNELLRKETIYDIERGLIMRNKYRSDKESLMYDVPTREEEAMVAKEEEDLEERCVIYTRNDF